MKLRTSFLVLPMSVLVGVASAASPAGAATSTTVGTTAVGTGSCTGPVAVWASSGPGVIPAGGGVITSLAIASDSTSGNVALKIVRGATILATTPVLALSAGGTASASGLNIPVQGGDALGLWTDTTGYDCSRVSTDGIEGQFDAANPAAGTTLTPTTSPNITLAISGTLEPDVDGDTYGDVSQDACPTIAQLHTAPCVLDIGLTATAVDQTVGVGELDIVQATISNASGATVTHPKVSFSLPAGVTLATTSGSCAISGSAYSCTAADIAPGGSSAVLLGVRVTTAGTHTLTLTASSDVADGNLANNTATVSMAAAQHTALQCVVPKVAGQTQAVAKRLLASAHCQLGKVAKKASAGTKGVVVGQAKKPGTKLAAGTKVNVTVRK